MWLKVAEGVLVLVLVLVVVTQLITPLMAGEKVFPMFRRRWKLERELTDVNDAIANQKLERKITTRRKSAKK